MCSPTHCAGQCTVQQTSLNTLLSGRSIKPELHNGLRDIRVRHGASYSVIISLLACELKGMNGPCYRRGLG